MTDKTPHWSLRNGGPLPFYDNPFDGVVFLPGRSTIGEENEKTFSSLTVSNFILALRIWANDLFFSENVTGHE